MVSKVFKDQHELGFKAWLLSSVPRYEQFEQCSVRVSKETGVWWRGALWAAPCPAPALATSHSQAPRCQSHPGRRPGRTRYNVNSVTVLHITQRYTLHSRDK